MNDHKKRLVIIDGKSVFYRGYYAMPNLSTKEGVPTGGVYGFAVLSLEVIKRLKPDYVCVAWDKPKTNIRKRLEMYPQYKAGRKPAPPDFYTQIPLLHEYLEACNWPLYELDDYEADDIMCSLAHKAEKKNIETIFITSDMDVLQCISPLVHVYLLKKGLSNIEELNPKTFDEKYGIDVHQFIDLKALKGDSSDNIPGVAGIGEKTAIDLLKRFKTLDGVYENLEDLKPVLKAKLETGEASARLSKKLVTLMSDAPIDLDLNTMDITKLDALKLQDILRKLEFRSLINQLPEDMKVKTVESNSLFDDKAFEPVADKVLEWSGQSINGKVIVYARYSDNLSKKPEFILISPNNGQTYFIDLKNDIKAILKSLESIELVGYDLKNLLKLFLSQGLKPPKVSHDIQVGSFLINPLTRDITLTGLAINVLGYTGANIEDMTPESIKTNAGNITSIIRSIYEKQEESLTELPKLHDLSKNIEWPTITVLAGMEEVGIKLDTEYLMDMSKMLSEKISSMTEDIFNLSGRQFNISSPQQLAQVLFEDLKLPTQGIKKTKSGFSTAIDTLDKLKDMHPIISLIVNYRELTKLKSTYVDTLPALVDEHSRIHTTFNLTVTATGRLSSNEPNLQNIPVRTEVGKAIRKAFVSEPGHQLVSADYSQFELRLAAILSEDYDLVEAFNSGIDVHTLTASQVFGVPLEDVTKDMRYKAKAVNFGILYGQTPHGLAAGTGMSFIQARDFIDKYFDRRTALMKYISALKEQAVSKGYVETLFGRRRPTPDVKSSNFIVREAALRQAVNMPIQGTEADLMKMAMIEVDKKLPKGAKQLLQIHDSILVECLDSQVEEVKEILKSVMENIYPELGIKLEVDVTSGKNWGEL